MDFTRIVEIAPAYVGLIIFVWYTITRDREWRLWLEKQNMLWLGFLETERDQRKEIMESAYRDFRSNMDQVSGAVGTLAKAMADHDANAQIRHEQINAAIREIDRV
jgi:hypothetical protein